MAKNTERPIAPSGFQPNLRVIPGTNGGGDVAEYIQPSASKLESGFYVTDRGLPWHVTLARRLNQPELMEGVARKLTVGEALVMAGLDWEVAEATVHADIDGTMTELPGRKVTYRKDTGAILSDASVSKRFTLVQNRDAFAFADLILDEGGANCESAGSLFGGRWVFLSLELPDDIHVEGDPSDYRLFLLISNGHDGSHRFRADVTVERTLCRNTLRLAQNRAITSWSIRHTSGVNGRVQQARDALGITHKYAEEFTAGAAALIGKSLPDRQVDDIIARLFPYTETQQQNVDAGKEPGRNAAQPVVRAIYHESPTIEPIRGTAYGVLSAVTEYVDHFRDYRDITLGSAEENRAEHLMLDDGDYKQRAWDLLISASDPSNRAKVK